MSRPFLLGLTGSIGMGKSTVARFFSEEGVPVWDADDSVHRLYAPGGAGASAIAELCHDAITADGGVDRARLADWISADPAALERIEAKVHPLVAADRRAFIETTATEGADIVVLDIPLLFETGADHSFDATIVVSAPIEEQRRRVLARPDMTPGRFEMILARQMPDAEKRRRATYVIPGVDLEETRVAVHDLIARIRRKEHHA